MFFGATVAVFFEFWDNKIGWSLDFKVKGAGPKNMFSKNTLFKEKNPTNIFGGRDFIYP